MASQLWAERDNLKDIIDEFPNAADRARIARYSEHRLLRHDHHEDVFPRVQAILDSATLDQEREKWAGLDYVPINLCGLLSKAQSNDLFLEMPTLSWGDDDAANSIEAAWQAVADRSGLHALALDEADGASVNGDVAFKLYVREGVGSIIDGVDVSLVFRGEDYFPEYTAANRDTRTTRYPFIATRHKLGDAWCVLLEIHEPGRVVHRAYRWDVSVAPQQMPTFADDGALTYRVEPEELGADVEDYDTGLPDPTLIVAPHDRSEAAFWGASDYTRGVKAVQDSINWVTSHLIQHAQKLLTSGTMVLPQEMESYVRGRDINGQAAAGKDYGRRTLTGGSVPTMSQRMLDFVMEHSGNAGVTRWIQILPQYEGAMKLLDGLCAVFENLTGMTLDRLFDQDKAPESGRAMRLSRYRDQRRIARRHVRWTDILQRVAPMALALDGVTVAQRPAVQWADPFKLSEQEQAEIINLRTAGKATLSVETAIQRFDGMSREQAKQESKRIDQDQSMVSAQVPRLFSEAGTFPDETQRPPGGEA